MNKPKILIVEDEPAIAEDLKDILLDHNYKVAGIANTYDQAMDKLASREIDLVFLDIALKGNGSGLDIAKIINEKYQLPFIFLTSFSDNDTIKDVVNLKPSGYLVKPFKERDLAPAIEVALASHTVEEDTIFPTITTINAQIEKNLSPQEYKVLEYIWRGHKNQKIAEDLYVSINTVKTHVAKIYLKLEVNSRSMALNKVLQL